MSQQTHSRLNDVLNEIHRDISGDLSVKHLAKIAAFSEQHFHRAFQHYVGESVHHYVCRVRLEQAANQLMFDQGSRIIDIAFKCGFRSLSSFSRAFKVQLGMAPGEWRKHHSIERAPNFMEDASIHAGYENIKDKPLPEPQLVETQEIRVAYLRHRGYNKSIRHCWQKLMLWAAEEGIKNPVQIALHHSNPTWVPLEDCLYVACIEIDKPLLRRSYVNSMIIPSGLHARFNLRGVYGELIPYISKIMTQWVPASGFKTKTTPSWVKYHKNQFLSEDQSFELDLYLPISLY